MPTLAIAILQQHSGHEWTTEHRFHPRRQWRFDYACPDLMLAIEVEGGAWNKGRHTRGRGFIDDMGKYNSAVVLGWRILRYTPEQFNGMLWVKDVQAIAEGEMTENNNIVTQCECSTWARDNQGVTLYLSHHPTCKHYRPEPEIRELLQRLLDGIEAWAGDEDGVHPDCWDAYVQACNVCGQFGRPRR